MKENKIYPPLGKVMQKQTILVVDDMVNNILLLTDVLNQEYQVKASKSGEIALKICQQLDKPDLILLDIMMPEMDGYQVCEYLKSNPTTKDIPVIFVSAKNAVVDETKGLTLGAVDYITKPISPPIVLSRVKTHLALYDQTRLLNQKVIKKTKALAENQSKVIQRLGRAAEYKDNETGMHVIRMSHYTHILAIAAGLNEQDAELLKQAAPMHDVGKIGIPDHILKKPGKLDANEWEIMMKHSEIGAEILGDDDSELLQIAKIVALNHHEKWDGSGYPNGLKGENIPLIARIVTIADVFDALTSERPYKKAWTVGDAIALLLKDAGRHFDPNLIPLFIDLIDDVIVIKNKFND